jgi:hypothetical protein
MENLPFERGDTLADFRSRLDQQLQGDSMVNLNWFKSYSDLSRYLSGLGFAVELYRSQQRDRFKDICRANFDLSSDKRMVEFLIGEITPVDAISSWLYARNVWPSCSDG